MADKIILTSYKRTKLRAKVFKQILDLKDQELISLINHLGCELDLGENDFEIMPLVMVERK